MAHVQQSNHGESVNRSILQMAKHVNQQTQLLLLDLENGVRCDALQSRLGGLSGAVIQMENLLNACQGILGNGIIQNQNGHPGRRRPHCPPPAGVPVATDWNRHPHRKLDRD
ncbi:MAG: hypothetical protein JSS71_02855 [Armatimonadetes bacterium]|nr:hypothetical protein [Armatimonadota bacterium]MBX3108321.1 hypothetical protein [Fimbriimonadaceae bacterium]